MLEQFLASVIAAITAFFGSQVPAPKEMVPAIIPKAYEAQVGEGTCDNVFDRAYAEGEAFSELWGANVLLQTCTNGAASLELRTDTETVANEKTTQDYTLYSTDTTGAARQFTLALEASPYGPACTITKVHNNWQDALITCMVGDGGFSLTTMYTVDLATGNAVKISSCAGRPLAILDDNGEIATYTTAEECTYPFGNTEDGYQAE